MKSNSIEKKEIEKLKKLNKKKKQQKSNYKWVLTVTIMAFVISFIFSFISDITIPNVNIYIGVLLLIVFVLIGILFDIIGVAVASCDIKPFHSMNAKKVRGADVAVVFIKNAAKVSSVCNDVIGDVCGIISGSTGIIIAKNISDILNVNLSVVTLITTSIIAALTIGGKALGKSFAINRNDIIVYEFSKIVSYFYHPKKLTIKNNNV